MNIFKTIANKTKALIHKTKKTITPLALATCALAASFVFGPQVSHAAVANLFAAADISGLSALVEALLTTFVGIMLLFVGYKYLKRSANRG